MGYPSFNTGDVLAAADMNAVGLWLIKTTTVTAQTSVDISDCFNADFDNYRIVINMNGSSNDNLLSMRMLDSTNTVIVGTSYEGSVYGQDYKSGTTGFTVGNANNLFYLGWLPNSATFGPMSATVDVFHPFDSTIATSIQGLHRGVRAGVVYLAGAAFGGRATAEQNKGIRLFNSVGTNMTGLVRVYGYRD